MTSFAMIEAVCDQLHNWHGQGRHLPHYVPACGKPHLLWLLGLGVNCDRYWDGGRNRYVEALAERITESQCNALLGPHGWAFYRVLVIRREMKDENENMEITNARL